MNKTSTVPTFLAPVSFYDETGPIDTDLALDNVAVTAIAVFAVFGIINLISTVYHLYLIANKKDGLQTTATAFSLYANAKKMFTVNSTSQFSCLHGIKTISMFAIVFGHSISTYSFIPTNTDKQDFLQIPFSFSFYASIHGSDLMVENFLVISGFLAAHSILNSLNKRKKVGLLLISLNRWLKITTILSIVVLAYCGLLPYSGDGPLWKNIEPMLIQSCRKYWWSSLLHIQNYLNPEEICIPPTWYLAVDMQIFILASLIILRNYRKPFVIYSVFSLLSALSVAVGFFVIWFRGFQGALFTNFMNNTLVDYALSFYVMPDTRMSSYLLGVMLGYMMYNLLNSRKQIKINLIKLISAWTLAAVLFLVCLYGGYFLPFMSKPSLATTVHASLVRPTWAILICWLIFACITDHAGFIQDFLSQPVFQVLSKVNYSLFLVHFGIIYSATLRVRAPLRTDLTYMLVRGVWHYGISLAGAFVITIIFELPLSGIGKLLQSKHQKDQTRKMQ